MSGKHTPMSIAHELCSEYNIGCVVCGDKNIEMHHYPSKGKMGKRKLSEILFVTIFPLCEKCHKEFHTQGAHKEKLELAVNERNNTTERIRNSHILHEHIDIMLARNVDTYGDNK